MTQDSKNKAHQQQGGGKQQANVKKQQPQQPASNGPKKQPAAGSGSSGKSSSKSSSSRHTPLSIADMVFATILFVTAIVMVLGATHLANQGRLSVLQPKDRKAVLSNLTTFAAKLEFTAKYWILGLVWLYFHLHVVIMNRVFNKAENPLAGHEDRVQAEKNVFSNSIEQFLISIASQTAALAYLSPVQVLNIIPLFNGLFLAGRVLFWLGYPKRRSFGFTTSMIPSTIAIFYTAYQFVVQHLDTNPDSLFKLNL